MSTTVNNGRPELQCLNLSSRYQVIRHLINITTGRKFRGWTAAYKPIHSVTPEGMSHNPTEKKNTGFIIQRFGFNERKVQNKANTEPSEFNPEKLPFPFS
jgi:hypothetical protein